MTTGLILAAATAMTGGTATAHDLENRQCTVEGDRNTTVAPFCGAESVSFTESTEIVQPPRFFPFPFF